MQNPATSANSQSTSEKSNESITLKWVNNEVVDVFRGNGWESWSRFLRKGNHFSLVAGTPLTNNEYKKLHEKSLR